MRNLIGGFQFVMNGAKYDYCYKESIESMLEFCDKVSVLAVCGEDETVDVLSDLAVKNKKLKLTILPKAAYDLMHGFGKYKLSIFQNLAASFLKTEYQILCQSDEIVHENSYEAVIRAATDGENGYFCRRINLWGSPYLQLDVPQERKPCSTDVIRLTKIGFPSVDDGENISCYPSTKYIDDIRIYHMGFVRKREIMKQKAIHMQEGVFEMSNHDNKLDNCDAFVPERWFSGEDLKPISEPLPKIIQQWAADRA